METWHVYRIIIAKDCQKSIDGETVTVYAIAFGSRGDIYK